MKIAAFPISTINPSAPPSIKVIIGDRAFPEDGGVDNRLTVSAITRKLRKYCKSDKLKDAVDLLKRAIEAISK